MIMLIMVSKIDFIAYNLRHYQLLIKGTTKLNRLLSHQRFLDQGKDCKRRPAIDISTWPSIIIKCKNPDNLLFI